MSILIGIIGIIVAIVLSTPVLAFISMRYKDWRRRCWSADLQVEKGVISRLDHYAYEYWEYNMFVDKEGNTHHSLAARLVNIGQGLFEYFYCPIYCDAINVNESEIKPWAQSGRTTLIAEVDQWNQQFSRGRLKISLAPPLKPGDRRRIRWGFSLPRTFREGDEYYNWDIATPHYEFTMRIKFDPAWTVQYARCDDSISKIQSPPEFRPQIIKGTVRFPERGKRITVLMGLSRDAP